MRASYLRLLALVAVLALAAAACGGGDTASEDADTAVGGATDAAADVVDEATEDDTADAEDTTDEVTEDTTDDSSSGDSTLVFGTTEQPSSIDPADVYEKFASDILFNTTNRLVEFGPGSSEVGPGLAESWEISEDGLTYTFALREGVTFQDGSDFTAEDVVFSLNRSLNVNHPDGASFLISAVESITAVDDFTVEIVIAEANSTFLSRLNYTVASILPSDGDVYTAPDALLEIGDADAEGENQRTEAEGFLVSDAIVGTGPYQMTDYQPGVSLTLERFDGYWGDAPAIDTVRVSFFEDSAQMRNALAAGEIDMVMNDFGPTEAAGLEGEDGIEQLIVDGGRTRYIVLDVTQAPFDDPAVRQAIATTVDRQRISDEVFDGQAVPLFSMIPSTFAASADYISDLETPELADGPIEFDLWYPLNKYGDTEADVAETIARSLNESGLFNVTTQSSDWATEYSSNLNTGAYAAYLLGWYPDYLDPDDYIEPFYDSVDTFIGFYGSDAMDQLITDEQQETDEAARADIFDQIQQLAAEDMPFIPLYAEGQKAFFSDRVQGVEDTVTAAQQTWFYVLSLN